LKQLIIMRINYNNFVTIFYIKIKNWRKIIINYNIGIRIKFCILSLLKKLFVITKINEIVGYSINKC